MPFDLTFNLTQYSKSSGCGCKIAPQVLDKILKSEITFPRNNLIVGNSTKDDAAVYDMGNGKGLISTTDFFTPIVNDAYDFGRIASANAISDVYAMGGRPLLAIAILGWPVDKLPAELAGQVLEGARNICNEANIPLAGGHSIDSPEPFFGLAVNGEIDLNKIKRNSTTEEGNLIYLTKPIGLGILSTATKRAVIKPEHAATMIKLMSKLNTIGMQLGQIPTVTAMTDVTGFGLLGHLIEMAEGSGYSIELNYNRVPLIEGINFYTSQLCVPDNTFKNWNSFEQKTEGITGDSLLTLCDPQTNGGILFSISEEAKEQVEKVLKDNMLSEFTKPIGRIVKKGAKIISVI